MILHSPLAWVVALGVTFLTAGAHVKLTPSRLAEDAQAPENTFQPDAVELPSSVTQEVEIKKPAS